MIPMSILIGLVVPLPFWLLHRRFPKANFDGVITPMICTQIGALAGGINSSIFGTFILCLISQFWIRKYHPQWFRKYNFLMSAALDGGTEVMVFVYSFAVRCATRCIWKFECSCGVGRRSGWACREYAQLGTQPSWKS